MDGAEMYIFPAEYGTTEIIPVLGSRPAGPVVRVKREKEKESEHDRSHSYTSNIRERSLGTRLIEKRLRHFFVEDP
jgi:hypothetical protein